MKKRDPEGQHEETRRARIVGTARRRGEQEDGRRCCVERNNLQELIANIEAIANDRIATGNIDEAEIGKIRLEVGNLAAMFGEIDIALGDPKYDDYLAACLLGSERVVDCISLWRNVEWISRSSFWLGVYLGTSRSAKRFVSISQSKKGGKRSVDVRRKKARDTWEKYARDLIIEIRAEKPDCTQSKMYELLKKRWPQSAAQLPSDRTVLPYLRKLESNGVVPTRNKSRK